MEKEQFQFLMDFNFKELSNNVCFKEKVVLYMLTEEHLQDFFKMVKGKEKEKFNGNQK